MGKVPLGEQGRFSAQTIFWKTADVRRLPELCVKPYTCVMADKLSNATVYTFRVRVRTIAGWSAWSEISDPILTKGV